MAGDLLLSVYVSAGVATALAVGSSFPALTSGGSGGSYGATYQSNVSNEFSYCRSNPKGVNCACYAQKAGYIMSYERTQVRGFNYADRTQLARSQAKNDC